MKVRLRVPMIEQDTRKNCWHASACMVQAYHGTNKLKRQGLTPDDPLMMARDEKFWGSMGENPRDHPSPRGLKTREFGELARRAGMERIRANPPWTSGMAGTYLANYGPLWCAGVWRRSGHVVVLTGVDGDTLYFNDPARGRIEYPLARFNERVDAVMYYKG